MKYHLFIAILIFSLTCGCTQNSKEEYIGTYGDISNNDIFIVINNNNTGESFDGNVQIKEIGKFKWEPNPSNGIKLTWNDGTTQDIFLTEDAPDPFKGNIPMQNVMWTLKNMSEHESPRLAIIGNVLKNIDTKNTQSNDPPLIFGIYMTKEKVKHLNKGLPYDSMQHDNVTFLTYKRQDHQQSFLFGKDNKCFMMKMIFSPVKEKDLINGFKQDKEFKEIDNDVWMHEDSVTKWEMLVNDEVLIINVSALEQ